VGELAAAELVDALSAHGDLPGGRLVEAADEIQQRRLARARRPHERDEIALGNVESEPVQHLDLLLAALVDLRHVVDLNHGL